jgi:hypothetical protein
MASCDVESNIRQRGPITGFQYMLQETPNAVINAYIEGGDYRIRVRRGQMCA